MQKRELLARLAQARQAQTRAMQRFAEMQARLAQLEVRLQASSSSQSAHDPNPAFLPANGELETQDNFVATPSQASLEETEPIALPRPALSDIDSAPPLKTRIAEEQL